MSINVIIACIISLVISFGCQVIAVIIDQHHYKIVKPEYPRTISETIKIIRQLMVTVMIPGLNILFLLLIISVWVVYKWRRSLIFVSRKFMKR